MTTTISLIGNYRVIRLLGEGGMGLVYEAVRDDIGARAAIKVLRPEFARNADIAGRFINEARAVNMVQHPGVVRVFDYGQLPTGEAYLAMEYLDGDSLRTRITRELRLSEADTMRIGRQIALAVAAAHAKQIVHRDLKPENIMIIADNDAPGGERAKVLDFGIAKLDPGVQGSVRTRTNTMMGTPVYMSPEQCRGVKAISDRSDVYSLGVMMFEMMTSRPPFDSEAPGDLIAMHMFKPPPSLREVIPDVDPVLQGMLEAMLSKDPQARPPMSAVAQQLKALGNLQSDVMPMRVVREPNAELAASSAGTAPPPQRSFPSPKPAAAPLKAAARPLPDDSNVTIRIRDSEKRPRPVNMKGPGNAAQPPPRANQGVAPAAPPSSMSAGNRWQPEASSDPTTAMRAEDFGNRLQKAFGLSQKQLERFVLLGFLIVAVLLGALVLLIGNHGDGAR